MLASSEEGCGRAPDRGDHGVRRMGGRIARAGGRCAGHRRGQGGLGCRRPEGRACADTAGRPREGRGRSSPRPRPIPPRCPRDRSWPALRRRRSARVRRTTTARGSSSEEKCSTLSESSVTRLMEDPVEMGDHLAATGSPWPENPNCIYMGGFGIGPMNPVTSWNEELGLWVRAVALRDRQGDDLVLVVLDGEGYFWDYGTKCDDCGIKQITAELAADDTLGLKARGHRGRGHARALLAGLHRRLGLRARLVHGAALRFDQVDDPRGARGDAPGQARVRRARGAPLQLRAPRHLPLGRGAAARLAARVRAPASGARRSPPSAPTPRIPRPSGRTMAQAHPDWPGLFEASLEERFGGVGMHFMTGLGNVSASGLGHAGDPNQLDRSGRPGGTGRRRRQGQPDRAARHQDGADHVGAARDERAADGARHARASSTGKFVQTPSTVRTGEDPDKFQCVSASPVTVEVAASAARIGDEFALTAAPGEIFSNFSNTVKEKSGAVVTMPLGQANDALGYMPQSFELNQVGQQGPGFVGAARRATCSSTTRTRTRSTSASATWRSRPRSASWTVCRPNRRVMTAGLARS